MLEYYNYLPECEDMAWEAAHKANQIYLPLQKMQQQYDEARANQPVDAHTAGIEGYQERLDELRQAYGWFLAVAGSAMHPLQNPYGSNPFPTQAARERQRPILRLLNDIMTSDIGVQQVRSRIYNRMERLSHTVRVGHLQEYQPYALPALPEDQSIIVAVEDPITNKVAKYMDIRRLKVAAQAWEEQLKTTKLNPQGLGERALTWLGVYLERIYDEEYPAHNSFPPAAWRD